MHAWLCENPVGVDALTWKELPTPQPGKGQVLIRIQAASLNFPDLLIVQNKYQMKPELPFVPGSEYAGVIEAVGEGVTDLKVGQAVACLSGTGGFATHVLAPAKLCMPLPPGFRDVPPMLCLGADMKNTFCLVRGDQAVVSQHFGDLTDDGVESQWRQALGLMQAIYDSSDSKREIIL